MAQLYAIQRRKRTQEHPYWHKRAFTIRALAEGTVDLEMKEILLRSASALDEAAKMAPGEGPS